MDVTQIKETALYVADLRQSKFFYQQIMGFSLLGEVEGRHVFFRAGNSVLLCFLAEATQNDSLLPQHFGSGQIHAAFEVPKDDYENWKTHLQKQGIAIEHEQVWENKIKSFYFRDPDGHCLEIVEPKLWGF
jgi:catechol-2,3-dioxygenase